MASFSYGSFSVVLMINYYAKDPFIAGRQGSDLTVLSPSPWKSFALNVQPIKGSPCLSRHSSPRPLENMWFLVRIIYSDKTSE